MIVRTKIEAILPYGAVNIMILANGLKSYMIDKLEGGVLNMTLGAGAFKAGDEVFIERDMFGQVACVSPVLQDNDSMVVRVNRGSEYV